MINYNSHGQLAKNAWPFLKKTDRVFHFVKGGNKCFKMIS